MASAAERSFRPDVEGLRAVAVVAVVLYHADIPGFPGGYVGVDVFFVISGYLITGLIWRRLLARHLGVADFYARRARRLLPAAMVVVAVTALASVIILPPLEVHSVLLDGVASALYVGNYRFAAQQANYLTATGGVSPYRHFWSLGVEEQFYLFWPWLLVAAAGGRRLVRSRGPVLRRQEAGKGADPWQQLRSLAGPSPRAVMGVLVGVGVISFVFSLWLTGANEPWAFYSLPTRAWELAVGGALAMAGPVGLRPGRVLAARTLSFVVQAVEVAGLGLIVWSVVGFGATTAFPGWAAVVPVGGAVLLIAGGSVRSGVVTWLLSSPPLRAIGRISYSWYLWHWPILVLAPYVVGRPGLVGRWILVLVSGLVATASYLLVENPLRRAPILARTPRRSLGTGWGLSVAATAVCLLSLGLIPSTSGHGRAPVAAIHSPVGGPSHTGGGVTRTARSRGPSSNPLVVNLDAGVSQVQAALRRSAVRRPVPANLNPPLADAAASEAAPVTDGCLVTFTAGAPPGGCEFGDISADRSVVLYGDSHAAMWFPDLDSWSLAHHYRLYVMTKAACPPVALSIFSPVLDRTFDECNQFRQSALSQIANIRPALVVLGIAPNYDSAYQVVQDGEPWLAGLRSVVRQVRADRAQVLVMGSVPSPPQDIPTCLSANLSDAAACAVPEPEVHIGGGGMVGVDLAGQEAEARVSTAAGGTFAPVQRWFCTEGTCPVVVDNLLVYRDNSHITVPFAEYLFPLVSDEIGLALQGPPTPSGSLAR